MIAQELRDILELKCPICGGWFNGTIAENGIIYADCVQHGTLAWGHEQDIEYGNFKGTAVSQ